MYIYGNRTVFSSTLYVYMEQQAQNIIKVKSNTGLQSTDGGSDFVVHSNLFTFEKPTHTAHLSIKMVLDGTERYVLNNQRYAISKGECLLVNEGDELAISFSETKNAEGICLYLNPLYYNQLQRLNETSEAWGLEQTDFSTYTCELLSKKYKLTSDNFGRFLTAAAHRVKENKDLLISEDFFIQLTEQLLLQQKGVYCDINRLNSTKLSTRKELYRRVALCKDYIVENCCHESLSIETLAAISMLSEVQLHRAFKYIVGMSPHQFVLEQKLLRARDLVQTNNYPLLEIAHLTGFSDLASFSKRFKVRFGVSPSQYVHHF